MSISRREFLATTGVAGVTAGALAADTPKLPSRVLGKTGARVSALAFGAGSRFLNYADDEQAIAALQKALDLGITYIDTADDYGKEHLSEKRVGQAIQGRRQGLFLATKLTSRDGSATERTVEESLKSLRVDQLDLLHIHSLAGADDLAAIEAKGGVLEQLQKLRDRKITRFIGITSHTEPLALKTAIERHDFDCVQMALNAGQVAMQNGGGKRGMVPNPEMRASFETEAMPVALRKKMGILAIKIYAQDHLIGQAALEKLLYYTLSLPVTAAVIGMPQLEHIDDNVRMVKAFRPLPAAEMRQMASRLSQKNKIALDGFFRRHVDA